MSDDTRQRPLLMVGVFHTISDQWCWGCEHCDLPNQVWDTHHDAEHAYQNHHCKKDHQ